MAGSAEALPPRLRSVPPAAEVNEARMYTYRELEDLTGISERWWKGQVAAGQITVFRPGDSRNTPTRIPHTALLAFIGRHLVEAGETA